MQTETLPSIIRRHVILPAAPNRKGWYMVLCKVCNDHGRKGKRGGFIFSGDSVGYNCFNCGSNCSYNPDADETISNEMVKVLNAYNIPEQEWQVVFLDKMIRGTQKREKALRNIMPTAIELPPYFYPLTDDKSDKWAQYAIEYLREDRCIDYRAYPFYLSRIDPSIPESKKWFGRLIIPNFKDDRVVFWQGRDLGGTRIAKYLSAEAVTDNIISDYKIVTTHGDTPIYVTEGWFDAFLIGGVCVFSANLSEGQIAWLNQTPRPKIVIPDRFGDGWRLAEQAISLGWGVSTPDIGSKCKDVSDAVKRFGLIYTLKTIAENVSYGAFAKTRVNLYCERDGGANRGKTAPRQIR